MPTYRESFVVSIACVPPALLWSGVGPLALAADAVIPEPAIALGAGELVSVPDFQQLMNGTAQRLDFQVSGVSAETVRLAIEDAPSVRYARVDIGRIDFDQDWQQIGPVEWEATFEARSLTVSRPSADDGNPVRTISLSIAHGDTIRSRAPLSFFTASDQARISPTDRAFDNVAGINAGTTRRFGPR